MVDHADLKAQFQSTLAKVTRQIGLLERLTNDLSDFYQSDTARRPAFLRVEKGGTWILAMYPPKAGGEAKYRIRTATLGEVHATQLQQALRRAGLPSEITTKNQRLSDPSGISLYCTVWRVDIAPAQWSNIDQGLVRLARQHLTEIRAFAVLDYLTAEFWGTGHARPGATSGWRNTDVGGYRLIVEAFGQALCLEKALEFAGVEFNASDTDTGRTIELLPAFVDRLLHEPETLARAKVAIATMAARYQRMEQARTMEQSAEVAPSTRTTETFQGFHLPYAAVDLRSESSLRRSQVAIPH